MHTILLTNDDGIYAEGLQELVKTISELGELWIVAPNTERSACGRSVTLHRPLRVESLGPRRFAVDGSPADCVLLAYRELLPKPPSLVISGINKGLNVGEDVDYSGTVGAAAEAALQGSRNSMAISIDKKVSPEELPKASKFASVFARKLISNPLPVRTFININIPANSNSKIRYTRQGNPLDRGQVIVDVDPRGKKYYWIAERPTEKDPPSDTDRGALRDECISISLLTLDRNHKGLWAQLELDEDGFIEEKV